MTREGHLMASSIVKSFSLRKRCLTVYRAGCSQMICMASLPRTRSSPADSLVPGSASSLLKWCDCIITRIADQIALKHLTIQSSPMTSVRIGVADTNSTLSLMSKVSSFWMMGGAQTMQRWLGSRRWWRLIEHWLGVITGRSTLGRMCSGVE